MSARSRIKREWSRFIRDRVAQAEVLIWGERSRIIGFSGHCEVDEQGDISGALEVI